MVLPHLSSERKLPMLEDYFVKPGTVDRIRASWIAAEIERYVAWMAEHGYQARNVNSRVPVLVAFGDFAREQVRRRWRCCRDMSRRSWRPGWRRGPACVVTGWRGRHAS